MWLNDKQVIDSAICAYQKSLLSSCPNHIVIDNLFNEAKLADVMRVLQQSGCWKTQKHTYSALYVDNAQWQTTSQDHRFVQRDVWQRDGVSSNAVGSISCTRIRASVAHDFLSFLRGEKFMSVLSRIINVPLTDMNVADPEINSNYFRLGATDFVEQHADDSPGRELCMLLYLNKEWDHDAGGELVFIGNNDKPISIAPLFNRCVLFDPSSKGSEHWVKTLNSKYADTYRYNVTSWYWGE